MAVEGIDFGGVGFVWRRKVTITVANGGTTGTVDIPLNGKLEEYVLVIPVLDGANTATLSLVDEDGRQWYASAAFALNTIQNVVIPRLLCGINTFKIVCSGVQTAQRVFTLYLKGSR